MRVLEDRYGVVPEFSGPLLPVLERLAAQQPSAEEWEQVICEVAAAYRSNARTERGLRSARQTRVLIEEFVCELRKIDESMKVLRVYVERLHQEATRPRPPARMLH